MAVQAQYPSNVLLLNRNGQDRKNTIGNDYSLQPHHQSGIFLDQSQMFFSNSNGGGGGGGVMNTNNNNINPRKRGRETINGGGNNSSTTTTTTSQLPINLFSLQSHQPPPPTLVNLSQLHNQQPNFVSTGLGLAFGEQQQHHHHHHRQQQNFHHQQQQQQKQSSLVLPSSSTLSSLLSDDISAQMKQQRDEIDQFLQAQGEHLRRTLAERRQRHYHALLGAAEESASLRLREKEAEVEKASRKNAELEERMAHLRMEAQLWQAKARAQEAAAASLQAQAVQLQQAIMSGGGGGAQDNRGEDGCGGGGDAEDAESGYIDPERVVPVSVVSSSSSYGGPMCKACRRRAASVVLLPCRHLCLCTECDTAVEACPLCLSYRSASVEVFLS